MKIFVDVGAHFGQSSLKALNYKFGFDLVIAYEPSKRAQKRLARIKDSRLRIKPFALGGESGQALLYGTGFLGASLFPDKVGIVEPTQTESIDVKTAHQELGEFLIEGNSVWLKMNCEGSELAILRDLYAFNLLCKFEQIWIDWDARKVPSLKEDFADTVSLLKESGCKYVNAHDFEDTGWIGVEKWLETGSNSGIAPRQLGGGHTICEHKL